MTSHSFNDFSVPIKPHKSTYKKQIARRQKRFNFAKIHIAHSYEACSVIEKYSKVCFLSYFSSRKYFLAVSYTHLRAHETDSYLVCRLLLEKKK